MEFVVALAIGYGALNFICNLVLEN